MSEHLEQLRKKALITKVISHAVCAIPLIFMVYWGIHEDEDLVGCIFGGLLIYTLLRVVYATFSKNKNYTEFVQQYKREMITNALNGNQLYDNMEFSFEHGIKSELVRKTGMLSTSRFYSDCFLSATYNGVNFFQADIRNVQGQRGGYHLEYDGNFIMIPTSLPDTAGTIVANKDVDINYIVPGSEYKGTSAEFQKIFRVYSNNHTKAAALLTPDFMSSLTAIQNKITGRIALTVKDGYMFIFLSKHGSKLKPKLLGTYDDSMKQSIIDELSRAKYFIDAFHLL